MGETPKVYREARLVLDLRRTKETAAMLGLTTGDYGRKHYRILCGFPGCPGDRGRVEDSRGFSFAREGTSGCSANHPLGYRRGRAGIYHSLKRANSR
jgi:hypothetical protein